VTFHLFSDDVFTGGTTCHSHESNNKPQRFSPFPMDLIKSCPTFFLFEMLFHSDMSQ